MRAIINLKLDKPLVLPIQYNHIVHAVVLKWLNDENYSKFIHETGYTYNNRKFKMFTFSKLEGRYTYNRNNKKITYYDEVSLIVSTADDEFLKYLVNNILLNSYYKILDTDVYIEKVSLANPKISTNTRIITKSPIVVYSTFEHLGKKKTYYYNPMEEEFEQLIGSNLEKKYIAFFNKTPLDNNLKITPIKNQKLKESIVLYKSTVIKGWNGEFILEGSEELIRMAYDAGLGSKNSQGFGCIELI